MLGGLEPVNRTGLGLGSGFSCSNGMFGTGGGSFALTGRGSWLWRTSDAPSSPSSSSSSLLVSGLYPLSLICGEGGGRSGWFDGNGGEEDL